MHQQQFGQQQYNQQSVGQQNIMPHPPNVVTTKDHLYLEDMLNWNLNVIKKANAFAQQCQDQQVKNDLLQVCMMHQNHYDRLLQHFQHSQANQQMR